MGITDTTLSRRRVLRGAATGAAGAAALAACGADRGDGPGVYAARVFSVPDDDPTHQAWDTAPRTTIELGPQDMVLPNKLVPAVTSLTVAALSDRERVAFLLEWDDPEVNDLTVRVDDFRDACAVLLVTGPPDIALRPMGSATVPATLLHWKADWQRDVDQGRQDLAAAYPNRSVDVYPPLWNVAPGDVDVATYQQSGASEWLPGIHVGNPQSIGGRDTPVEKAIAWGFSTTKTSPTQDARGRGVRVGSRWKVALSKPLTALDDGELDLSKAGPVSCTFAVWSGASLDAGSRKSPALAVHPLFIEA